MKNNLKCSFVPLLLIFIFGVTKSVLACSCVPTAPCQQFGNSDVSFVGKVVGSKRQITENDYSTDVTRKITYDVGEVYFQVTEAFAGVEKGSRVTIHSNTGGGDCGVWLNAAKHTSFLRAGKAVKRIRQSAV